MKNAKSKKTENTETPKSPIIPLNKFKDCTDKAFDECDTDGDVVAIADVDPRNNNDEMPMVEATVVETLDKQEEQKDYIFEPDEELLKFATNFSDNYKDCPIGDYFSENKKYHISYVDEVIDRHTEEKIECGARIGHDSHLITIDKSFFSRDKITSDFLWFVILWCTVEVEVKNIMKSDLIVLQ